MPFSSPSRGAMHLFLQLDDLWGRSKHDIHHIRRIHQPLCHSSARLLMICPNNSESYFTWTEINRSRILYLPHSDGAMSYPDRPQNPGRFNQTGKICVGQTSTLVLQQLLRSEILFHNTKLNISMTHIIYDLELWTTTKTR